MPSWSAMSYYVAYVRSRLTLQSAGQARPNPFWLIGGRSSQKVGANGDEQRAGRSEQRPTSFSSL